MSAGSDGGGSVGKSVRRKEDGRLITGRGRFVSDLQLPRMQHVAFLRSPMGHARIAAIDTSRADGYRVFTGAQDAFKKVVLRAESALRSYVETEQPILAWDKVRFAGEAIAAVVAPDRYRAEDGLELIDIDLEPLGANVCAWREPTSPIHDGGIDRSWRAAC